jgi:hypothetical protein
MAGSGVQPGGGDRPDAAGAAGGGAGRPPDRDEQRPTLFAIRKKLAEPSPPAPISADCLAAA